MYAWCRVAGQARTGHDGPRAALIYQHRTSEADQAIARGGNERLEAERRAADAKRVAGDREKPGGLVAHGARRVIETVKALTGTSVLTQGLIVWSG